MGWKHYQTTKRLMKLAYGFGAGVACDRDIGRKAVLGDVKTAYTFTPTLAVKRAVIIH